MLELRSFGRNFFPPLVPLSNSCGRLDRVFLDCSPPNPCKFNGIFLHGSEFSQNLSKPNILVRHTSDLETRAVSQPDFAGVITRRPTEAQTPLPSPTTLASHRASVSESVWGNPSDPTKHFHRAADPCPLLAVTQASRHSKHSRSRLGSVGPKKIRILENPLSVLPGEIRDTLEDRAIFPAAFPLTCG